MSMIVYSFAGSAEDWRKSPHAAVDMDDNPLGRTMTDQEWHDLVGGVKRLKSGKKKPRRKSRAEFEKETFLAILAEVRLQQEKAIEKEAAQKTRKRR